MCRMCTGGQAQCLAFAGKLNSVVVGCGKASAGRKDRGFSCVPAWDRPGESVLGTAGSARDCKIITKTLTKALKKVSKKPVIKFVCEAYGGSFLRIKVKNARNCEDHVVGANTLAGLLDVGDFANCAVRTTTTAKPGPPANLGCLAHHSAQDGTGAGAQAVLQSSEATCPSQVAELNTILRACGLKDKFAGGITCSAAQDGASMLLASTDGDTAKMTARSLTKAVQAHGASLPAVAVVQGAYSHSRSLCSSIAGALNAIIEAGTADFTCDAPGRV